MRRTACSIVLVGLSVVGSACVRLFEESSVLAGDATVDAPGGDSSMVDPRRDGAAEVHPDIQADAAPVDPFSPFTGVTPVDELNTTDFDEEEPALTADMLEIYFNRNKEIWRSTRPDLGSGWSAPEPLVTGPFPHGHPSISADGLLLLYSVDASAQYRENIYAMTRDSRSAPWGDPSPVDELNSTAKEFAGGMTPDKCLLVLMRSVNTDFDLFLSTRGSAQGLWTPPQPINELNSPAIENRPWIDPAAVVIYFDSERPGAAMRDIFVSVRPDPSATWATPVPLASLNTAGIDSDVWLSPDLRTVYFSSDRNGGSLEIFTATRE